MSTVWLEICWRLWQNKNKIVLFDLKRVKIMEDAC